MIFTAERVDCLIDCGAVQSTEYDSIFFRIDDLRKETGDHRMSYGSRRMISAFSDLSRWFLPVHTVPDHSDQLTAHNDTLV